MANQEHYDLLCQGATTWNEWRKLHQQVKPDFSGAKITGADLRGADLFLADFHDAVLETVDLRNADLRGANFTSATLIFSDLSYADLSFANLSDAQLSISIFFGTNLEEATLQNADLTGACLDRANLRKANLVSTDLNSATLIETNVSNANLNFSRLIRTDFTRAILSNCSIYGISVWEVELEGAKQENLTLTGYDEAIITVDNLKIAQFLHLLLKNEEIRDVFDTITSKVVLILGRFTPPRKAVLDAIRNELRKYNYLPVIFDFNKPSSRDLTETVSILAHLARFIIVDLTDPSSAPHEVATIIPQTIVPVQPLLTLQPLTIDGKAVERHEYAMFEDLRKRYHWVLPTFRYQDTADLLISIQGQIIEPAEQKAQELAKQ